MVKRPTELIYGVGDVPPVPVILLLSLQHLALIAIYLVIAVTVARMAGLDAEAGGRLVSLTMIAGGVGAVLQVLGRRGIGSGFLVPTTTTTILLPPAGVAIAQGGLPLLFGMSMVTALTVIVLSQTIRRLRPLFPAEIAGFVVFIVGISVMVLAERSFLGVQVAAHLRGPHLAVAILTLATIVGISVWGGARLRLFCPLIGIGIGYAASLPLEQFPRTALASLEAAPLFALPRLGSFGIAFDAGLLIPFLIAGLAMSLNTVGAVTAAQKANDAEWKRPDIANIGRGLLADGLANLVAGLIGGVGQSSTSGAVGLSVATGATCRVVGFGIAALLFLFALSPKLSMALLIMPDPVIGAALLFSGCFLVVNGMQVMASRLLDPRKVFMLGISLTFGLARLFDPEYFRDAPRWLEPWVGSPMTVSVSLAILLNALFRIGIHKRSRFTIDGAALDPDRLDEFMTAQGQLWGAGPEVAYRARFGTHEVIEMLVARGMVRPRPDGSRPIAVSTRFDEFSFAVTVGYDGEHLALNDIRLSEEEIFESEDGERHLAKFMIRRVADSVKSEWRGERGAITLLFHA
ncbi:MAG TPA: solute carrier family 23 protein [Azospirillum sp.]|nr:solute carrier family 23 protein [Azospirillum sp.]